MTSWKRPSILHLDNAAEAQAYLEKYFAGTTYSGSYFEAIGQGGDASGVADRVTSDDLVALAMLSVPVQGAAARELLSGDAGRAVSAILKRIPAEANLVDERGRAILRSDDGLEAWQAVKKVRTFGPVRTSKLLARKRPHLVPIYDRHIKEQFGAKNAVGQWATWVEMFADEALVAHLTLLRERAGVAPTVSLLRVMDVVVWMAGKYGEVPQEISADVDEEI